MPPRISDRKERTKSLHRHEFRCESAIEQNEQIALPNMVIAISAYQDRKTFAGLDDSTDGSQWSFLSRQSLEQKFRTRLLASQAQ